MIVFRVTGAYAFILRHVPLLHSIETASLFRQLVEFCLWISRLIVLSFAQPITSTALLSWKLKSLAPKVFIDSENTIKGSSELPGSKIGLKGFSMRSRISIRVGISVRPSETHEFLTKIEINKGLTLKDNTT